jgi:hypothetical protein
MKPNYKFLRVALAASLGAALWAGCASDRPVSREPLGDPADEPVDLTVWRPNTHPEWVSGVNFNLPNPLLMPKSIVEPNTINDAAGAELHPAPSIIFNKN